MIEHTNHSNQLTHPLSQKLLSHCKRVINGPLVHMFSFLHTNPTIEISINTNDSFTKRAKEFVKTDLPILPGTGSVTGTIRLTAPPGKVVGHRGIVMQLFGDIRADDVGHLNRFLLRKNYIEPAGDFGTALTRDFCFDNIIFPTSTYVGVSADVVYGIEVVVTHAISDFTVEQQFVVIILQRRPRIKPYSKVIGIQNILHVEFKFPQKYFSVNEPIIGVASFQLVKLRIVAVEVMLYKGEEYNDGMASFNDLSVLRSYEVLDGTPCRGDRVPVRLFPGDAGFWPFLRFAGGPLTVEHYLRIVVTDENGKQYSKRLDIEFGRYVDVE